MIKALDMAVDDIINNKEISEVSKDLFKNDVNSLFLKPFTVAANMMFKQVKKKIK